MRSEPVQLALVAGSVVLLWGLSSLLRELANSVPALELTALALFSAAVCGVFAQRWRRPRYDAENAPLARVVCRTGRPRGRRGVLFHRP
jgi:hypothetical protein